MGLERRPRSSERLRAPRPLEPQGPLPRLGLPAHRSSLRRQGRMGLAQVDQASAPSWDPCARKAWNPALTQMGPAADACPGTAGVSIPRHQIRHK